MPTLLFWNVARVGAGDASEDLDQSLVALSQQTGADVIVLCEVNVDQLDHLTHIAPPGYAAIAPVTLGTATAYPKDTTLRYAVFATDPQTPVTLIPVASSTRPLVLVRVQQTYILCVHAPSVSQTSVPQANTFHEGYTLAAAQPGVQPMAIMGDMNVDLKAPARVSSLVTQLTSLGSPLLNWNRKGPGHTTQTRGGTLDWALCDPAFTGAVAIPGHTGGAKKAKPKPRDDDDWPPVNLSTDKGSDHSRITLTW
jgi:hypothetical protein